ncbi:MAG: hypothetical protein ACRDQB_04825 [Thermocrispum sp.]
MAVTPWSGHLDAGSVIGVNQQLIVLILVVVGAYVLSCLLWPYTKCGRCKGGKHPSPSGRAWRSCGACGGKGRKLRLGAHLFRSE